jgi:hypothetical protein
MAMRDVRRAGRGRGRNGAKERLWREHVARQAAGGLTVRAYCERHALAEPSFYAWRRELARRDAAADRGGRRSPERPSSRAVPFVQLKGPQDFPCPTAVIEIVLTGGTVVRVPRGADEGTLAAVLTTLRARPC